GHLSVKPAPGLMHTEGSSLASTRNPERSRSDPTIVSALIRRAGKGDVAPGESSAGAQGVIHLRKPPNRSHAGHGTPPRNRRLESFCDQRTIARPHFDELGSFASYLPRGLLRCAPPADWTPP